MTHHICECTTRFDQGKVRKKTGKKMILTLAHPRNSPKKDFGTRGW